MTRPALFPCRLCRSSTWAVHQTSHAPRVSCANCGKFVGYDLWLTHKSAKDSRAPEQRRPQAATLATQAAAATAAHASQSGSGGLLGFRD